MTLTQTDILLMLATQRNGPDVDAWPVDVQQVVSEVCKYWYLKPPTTKKAKAYWIASARELLDACAEFGEALIAEYRLDFEAAMEKNRQRSGYGLAPFTVEGPGSLVKAVRAKAGEKRGQGQENQAYKNDAKWLEDYYAPPS